MPSPVLSPFDDPTCSGEGDPFAPVLQALAARSSKASGRAVPINVPAERITLAGGEVVELPHVPRLARHDVVGWKAHVHGLLQRSAAWPQDQQWRHRLDDDAAQPLLRTGSFEPLGIDVQTLLQANVSSNPQAGSGLYISAGMQEALIGLTLALRPQVAPQDVRCAARYAAHPRLVQRLIDACTGPNGEIDPTLLVRIPDVLHQAVFNRHPAGLTIIERLIGHGADTNRLDSKDCTALCQAVAIGHVDAMTVLLRHGAAVDPDPQTNLPAWRESPLMIAVRDNRGVMVHALLSAGARPVCPMTHERPHSAWEYALVHGSPAAIQALIDHGEEPFAPEARLHQPELTLLEQAQDYQATWKGKHQENRQACVALLEALHLRRLVEQEGKALLSEVSLRTRARL